MPLLQLLDLSHSVGGPPLLDHIGLTIEAGERVCIVGRNGAGKSTLLRIIAGEIVPDEGERRLGAGVRVARLAQEVPQSTAGSIFDVITAGLGDLGHWLARYHALLPRIEEPAIADEISDLQERIESAQGWDLEQRVEAVLSRLGLDGEAQFAALSGGMKRRVLLGQALVSAPDILLLDEPTNHLDIDSIDWLEEMLKSLQTGLVFITHDRRFLRALATRIVEIDRGQLSSWPGNFDNYLRRREERLHAEAQAAAHFDRKLAEEEVWIRQGIKARRTRNEGRVRALKAMRSERQQRRELQGQVNIQMASAAPSGKRVAEAKRVTHGYAGRTLLQDFSINIQRGDRIGLVGPNGVGKTTLIRLLLGESKPDSGEIELGTQLQVAYFDQHRLSLREDWNALENVAEGREYIELDGRRKHALGYLQDFLFTPERARAPITMLSGGERNRLLLAKLFAQPSNLLVMDEPTNDLDVETLELLEEKLGEYPGTLILVSHDREFLDNVVTSCLVFEGEGLVREHVGGYSDWLAARGVRGVAGLEAMAQTASPAAVASGAAGNAGAQPASEPAPRKKLGYKEQRELEQLPLRIEQLEAGIADCGLRMADPAFYQQPADTITAAGAELARLQAELEQAYARWAELDG
ncbi:MAG: ATP-binding cassette domain-containing protein [Aquimonas sp.]|nr:ATP-binding cassette domain-containing protein [Aquimonas sp.]